MNILHCTSVQRHLVLTLASVLLGTVFTFGKVREIGKPLPIRPVTIRNVDYGADGKVFTIPNFVSAGSVALFWVTDQGEIARVPSRLSEKNFVRSSGLYFLRREQEATPQMAFVSLPELLTGYSVDFSANGLQLAICGGAAVIVYDGTRQWEKTRTLTIGVSVTRAVFSPDGTKLAVISDGKLFLFSTDTYALLGTIEPAGECRFSDATFSNNNMTLAVFEFRSAMLDFASRIRIFNAADGSPDHDLPFFPVRPSSEPGVHLPLVSYSPGDSLLAVTIPTAFTGKIYLIKSNDGTIVKEFKGFCHAFSPDGTLFAANNSILSVNDWSILGALPRSSVACTFSPTERVIIVVTQESIRRFRIDE